MSKSSAKPRIKRKHDQSKTFARTKYRKALPLLLEDFEHRCAYSMVHLGEVGDSEKHIDHFDPASKKFKRVKLGSLMLASPHCNIAKGDSMPIAKERRLGIRFLNPCQESDYNVEIFEDPLNGSLVGTTPRAKWHIFKLGLNSPHLLRIRQKRREQITELSKFQKGNVYFFPKDQPLENAYARFKPVYDLLLQEVEKGIPVIAPPPTD